MVMSEVSKDPPSPFLTVQSECDDILLPVVLPAPQQQSPASGCDGARSWHGTPSCSSQVPGHSFSSLANQRTHLQSIVSQQSLNFSVHPDSPYEFELGHPVAAASASAGGQHSKVQQAAVAAGHSDLAAQAALRQQQYLDAPAAAADDRRRSILRFLPLGGSWLRSTQSVPHSSHKRQAPQVQQLPQHEGEPSFKQIRSVLDKQDVAQDELLQQQLQPLQSRKLKCRVHKLLAWASVKATSASAASSPQVAPAQLGPYGSLTFTPGMSSQQPVPIPWQHQVFTEPSLQPSVQLINATPGTPPPLRSPRSSLVSSPSSCDCPLLVGRFSSTGSDAGYGRSPGYAGASGSIGGSQSCSLTTTPSPGKALVMALTNGNTVGRTSMNGCGAVVSGGGAPETPALLKMTSSVRMAHHRHRQHRPGCRFHPQQQQSSQLTTPASAHHQLAPASPSIGGLMPQSSLRTALQQLESMASYKAARIMDKLNAGLQKVTSHRVFDGVLRQGTVGREVMRDWELGPTLGMGASCVTRLVTNKSSGMTAACKSISKQGILHSSEVKAAMLAVQREVAILQAVVGHPHVVALRAVYEDVHSLHMIMDWCGGGTLWHLMERCPDYQLPEAAAAAATRATLMVLAHCHARGVVHRDIKPDNLLVSRPLDSPQELTADLIKVTDFGISVPLAHGQVLCELAGTMGYMAPEVLRRSYTEAADIWSAGVMLYEMVCGQLPFSLGNTCDECLTYIDEAELDFSQPVWQAVAPEARALVAAMLTKDPASRPSAQKLLDKYSAWLSRGDQLDMQ